MKNLKLTMVVMVLSCAVWTLTSAQDLVVRQPTQEADQQVTNTKAGSSTTVQNFLIFDLRLKAQRAEEQRRRLERAEEVRQDNEYTVTGNERGVFVDNPLMIDGVPLDYSDFTLESTGELTVIKKVDGKTVEVPFYIHLRRDGVKVLLPQTGHVNSKHMKVNLSDILDHAKMGDHLVIEAVNKEDGAVKRILKLLNSGC